MGLKMEIRKDNTDEVISEIDSAVMRAMEIIGLKAESYAKRICPVDTGRLRNSISHATAREGDGYSALIGTKIDANVKYARYVEMGTSRMRAQPYLRPAAKDHTAEYANIIVNELKKG